MSTEEIRKQAANDYAWAESRMATYREDGATPPEPIRRLHALTDMICKAPAVVAASNGQSDDVERLKIALATAEARATAADAARAKMRADSVLALRDSASVLAFAAKHLEADGTVPVAATGGMIINAPPGVEVKADQSTGAIMVTRGDVTPDRHPIPLCHGLVLQSRKDGTGRVIFSEQYPGQWTVQTLHADNTVSDSGPTTDGKWWSDVWTVITAPPGVKPLPHHSEAKPLPTKADGTPADPPKGQQMIPGSGPEPVAATSAKIRFADWNPDDAVIAGHAKTLGEEMKKAGVSVEVTTDLVKSLVAKFKVDKGSVEGPKPGLSFYHWAKAALKGK